MSSREQNQNYAQESLDILKSGKIGQMSVQEDISKMFSGTKCYIKENGDLVDVCRKRDEVKGLQDCKITVVSNDTLVSVRKQLDKYWSSCALNFASAKHPGGGFKNGAMAQEEAMCYSTLLYGSLEKQKRVYDYSIQHTNGGLYSTWTIYTPNVIIYRDATMRQIKDLCRCSFITSPAPNKSVFKGKTVDLRNTVYERCRFILDTAIANNERNLVLGAFGCGVFGNSPMEIATCWSNLLFKDGYAKCFDNIEFAILSRSDRDENFRAFKCVFARKLNV